MFFMLMRQHEPSVIKAEKEWYYIFRGELFPEKINDLLYNIRHEINIVEKAFINDSTLPCKNKFVDAAQKYTEQYFQRYLLREN